MPALHKNYGLLKTHERFSLLYAATARGDEVEVERLTQAARRVTFSMADHAIWVLAFEELATTIFIDLVDASSKYAHAIHLSDHYMTDQERAASELVLDSDPSLRQRKREGLGHFARLLLDKFEGWTMFCAEHNVPVFHSWKNFPGYERLQQLLERAKTEANSAEESLRFLNRIRPQDHPPIEALAMSPADYTDGMNKLFGSLRKSWSGE